MKRLLCIILITALLVGFGGCQTEDKKTDGNEYKETQNNEKEELQIPTETDYSMSPYRNEGDDIHKVLSKVVSNKYEAYPGLHVAPISATLYKGGEAVQIELTDPRLIRLVNLFNNSLYYEDCEYLLSYLTEEDLKKDVMSEDFRLELKYEPFGDTYPAPYENMPTQFDTVIVTNSSSEFVLINHSHKITLYDGKESVLAAGYYPLTYPVNDISAWLESFGF